MGKHIVAQRRGKGSLTYRSPSHRHVAPVRLNGDGEYTVKDIIHAPGRNAPLLIVKKEQGPQEYQLAFNGARVGQTLLVGSRGKAEEGATLPLGVIPDGAYVHNIESIPGDGGKFCRTAGAAALIISHGNMVTLKLTSGKMKLINPKCRASIGAVAGSGARDMPILKAGRKVRFAQSKARRPYSVRGVAMNAVNHPHGGGNHQHVGRPSTVGRGAPPGRKVGRLSPKRRKK